VKQLYKNVLLWAVILVMFVAFYQFFNSHNARDSGNARECEPLTVNGRCEDPEKYLRAIRSKDWGANATIVACGCDGVRILQPGAAGGPVRKLVIVTPGEGGRVKVTDGNPNETMTGFVGTPVHWQFVSIGADGQPRWVPGGWAD
jgi:hypothetical protein